jgi:two-component system cell cycle sensor histidine kinase/response regulator CckA
VLSAAKDRGTVIASLRAGGRDFIPKEEAFDSQKLKRRIDALVKRVRLEQRLLQQQKDECVTTLVAGVAHDFNNLLVGMLGNAGLALAELPEESPACALIEHIERAARRAADLTRQMLAYAGRGGFVVGPVNLSNLLDEMGPLLKASISKKVALEYELTQDLPCIEADATQVRQVMMNLIINASEAIGDRSGLITIRTGVAHADHAYLSDAYLGNDLPEDRYAFIEVTDTGCGMDEATRSKMFDPFFTTKFAGRGLGLAAVLGIVRGHRGAIKVQSALGRGSSFEMLFPISQLAAQTVTEDQPASEQPRAAGTLLVVDDEEPVRSVAQMVLERSGFTVLTANDGREALEVFRAHRDEIDAVLLDLTMPELSGEEVFRELRRMRADVPIILSSGYVEEDATARFAGMGLAAFIQKPYPLPALAQKVEEVLQAG